MKKTEKQWIKDGRLWDGSYVTIGNSTVWNPTDEQMIESGYTEYVEPEPTPEELLERAKQQKLYEIDEYDRSDNVNGFEVVMVEQSVTDWIEPEKRSNYRGSLDDCVLLGVTDIEVPIAGMLIPMTVADARVKLAQIQLYADRCTIVTETHKAAVQALTTVEEVEAYDITAGYPSKLVFNI